MSIILKAGKVVREIETDIAGLSKTFGYFESTTRYNEHNRQEKITIFPESKNEMAIMEAVLSGTVQDLTKFKPKPVIETIMYFVPNVSLFALLPREMDPYFLEATEYLSSMNDIDICYYLFLITKYKKFSKDIAILEFLIKFLEEKYVNYREMALECWNDVIISVDDASYVDTILFTDKMFEIQNNAAFVWMFGKIFIECLYKDNLRAIILLDTLSDQFSYYLEALYREQFTPEMKEIAINRLPFRNMKIETFFEKGQFGEMFEEIKANEIPRRPSPLATTAYIKYLSELSNESKKEIFDYNDERENWERCFFPYYKLSWGDVGNILVKDGFNIDVFNGRTHFILEQKHDISNLPDNILNNYLVEIFKLCKLM